VDSKDLSEYEKQYRDLLRKLSEVEAEDLKTKKALVLRMKEVVAPLIESGKFSGIKKQDTALFLYNQLSEYGVTYDRSHFYELFNENEKRNYYQSSDTLHSHNFIQDPKNPRIKTCDCGETKIDDIVYEQKTVDEEPKEKTERPEPELNLSKEEKQGLEYLQRVIINSKNLADLTNDILEKFKKDKELRSPILKEVDNITQKVEEQKGIESKILALTKMADFRNKVGPFEKIMAKVLIDTTYNIAAVAKLLSISPKHATNNIVKQDHYEKLKWFRCCFKCGADIADWANEEILRKQNFDKQKKNQTKDFILNSKLPTP